MGSLSTYIKFGIVLTMTLLLANCGNKGNSNNNNSGVPIGGIGYGGMPGGSGVLFEAPAHYSSMAMTLRVYGDQMMINQLAYTMMAPAKVYSGQAGMQGALMVNQNLWAGNCIIPAGTYQMSGSVGSYQMGTFAFQQIQMTNGQYQVMATLNGVIIDSNADGIPEGFGAQLYFIQGPSQWGQYTGCSDPIGFTLAP
jgi:hypothetical protein